jgi:hypothetical protein
MVIEKKKGGTPSQNKSVFLPVTDNIGANRKCELTQLF